MGSVYVVRQMASIEVVICLSQRKYLEDKRSVASIADVKWFGSWNGVERAPLHVLVG